MFDDPIIPGLFYHIVECFLGSFGFLVDDGFFEDDETFLNFEDLLSMVRLGSLGIGAGHALSFLYRMRGSTTDIIHAFNFFINKVYLSSSI